MEGLGVMYMYIRGVDFLSRKNRSWTILGRSIVLDYRGVNCLKKKERNSLEGVFSRVSFRRVCPLARCCGNVCEKWALCPLKLLENCGRKSENESGVRSMVRYNKSVWRFLRSEERIPRKISTTFYLLPEI